jgi:hypothetical protein
MSDIIVINNEFVTLVYHPDTKIVHHTIHQAISGEQFRTLLTEGRTILEKQGAVKWLSDNRKLAGLSEEDMKWSTKEWIPLTLAAGWKYWALVVPDAFQARANLAHVVNTFYDKGLRIMVFTQLEEAMRWLADF